MNNTFTDWHTDCLTEITAGEIAEATKLALRISSGRLPATDAEEAANTALFEASRRYDPAKGASFKTYLTKWVEKEVRDAISAQSGVYLPDATRKLRQKVCKMAALGMPLAEIAAREALHMDELLSLLAVRTAELPHDAILEAQDAPQEPSEGVCEALAEALGEMPERVAEALLWLFGVDRERLDIDEIAAKMGVSRRTIYNWIAAYAPHFREVAR